MKNIKDDRGFNQVWPDSLSTRIRAARRCDLMLSKMDINTSGTILEIGCGTGANAFAIAQKTNMKVLGVDICVPFIEQAKKDFILPNLQFEVVDFNNPTHIKNRKFGYIIGNGILHHLYYNLDDALKTLRDLLEDNGKIIFMEPNIHNPYVYLIFSYGILRKKAHLEPDEMAFSKEEIEARLKKTGYRNVKVKHKDFLLPGIPSIFIKPSIVIGSVLEKVPMVNRLAQSIFIEACK